MKLFKRISIFLMIAGILILLGAYFINNKFISMKTDKRILEIEGQIITKDPLVISDNGSRTFLLIFNEEGQNCLGTFNRSIEMNVGDLIKVKGESIISSPPYSVKKLPYADIISICNSEDYFIIKNEKVTPDLNKTENSSNNYKEIPTIPEDVPSSEEINKIPIEIIPITPTDNMVWKIGSDQKISWEVKGLPNEKFNTVVYLRKADYPDGAITQNKAKNGINSENYTVGMVVIGGDAHGGLEPGIHRIIFSIYRPPDTSLIFQSYGDLVFEKEGGTVIVID